MNKIKTVSFYVARLFDFLVAIIPAYIILQWIFIDIALMLDKMFSYHDGGSTLEGHASIIINDQLIYLSQVAWTPLTQFIGCMAQLIEYGPFLGILYFLAKIFHRYEVGKIFTLSNAQCYYNIGKLLFFDALLAQPISECLWVLAVTLSNPVGKRCIRFTIGTPNIMAIFIGLLVILISWVMIEGSTMQDEQQLTI